MKKLYECNNCGYTTPFEPDQCVICGETAFELETIKTTEADRIRSMSDEDIALEIEWFMNEVEVGKTWNHKDIIGWLQQEVE